MNGEMYAEMRVVIQVWIDGWEDGLLRHIPIFLFILRYRKCIEPT